MECPGCHAETAEDAGTCELCGAAIADTEPIGTISPDASACAGVPAVPATPIAPLAARVPAWVRRSRWVRVLAIVLVGVLLACGLLLLLDPFEPKDVTISIAFDAPGLDAASGSKIPVQVTGTDVTGKAYHATAYLSADDGHVTVPEGDYAFTVEASPIAGDGTMYDVHDTCVEGIVSSEDGFQVSDGGEAKISLKPLDSRQVTDAQLEAAYEAARDGGAENLDVAEVLRETALAWRRSAA